LLFFFMDPQDSQKMIVFCSGIQSIRKMLKKQYNLKNYYVL